MFSKCLFFVLLQSVFRNAQSLNFWPEYEYLAETKSYYKIHTMPKTWNDAKTHCEREGAKLFYPEHNDEASTVISLWEEKQPFIHWVFIGMTTTNDNVFKNADGKPLNNPYNIWNAGEPNNIGGREECLTMNDNGELNDENCDKTYPFICKASVVSWNEGCRVSYPEYEYKDNLGKCYKLHTTRRNWTDAYTICKTERSNLAIINSEEERDYFKHLVKDKTNKDNDLFHLGFFKRDTWITVAGDLLHNLLYDNSDMGWGPSQPDGGINENCGSMALNGELHDVACHEKMMFICEHDIITKKFDVAEKNNDDSKFRDDYRLIDANYYKFHSVLMTWNEAKVICERESAALFYPVDKDEFSNVIHYYWNITHPSFNYIFIGIANWIVKDVLDTIDGVPLARVYREWAYGEPNMASDDEGCVILQKNGILKDDNCNLKYPFICKRSQGITQWNMDCNLPYDNYVKKSDTCYKFHLTPRNWHDAKAVCEGEESSLAVINSMEERNYLVKITRDAAKNYVKGDFLRGGVHLGFYKSKRDGWITVNGGTLHDSGYKEWAYNQPDGEGSENCGSMLYNGQLNDIGCHQKMFFICEHKYEILTVRAPLAYGVFYSHLADGQASDKFFRKDYTYLEDTASFYKLHTMRKSWENARIKCEREGATLFYPEDEDEALSVIAYWNQTQPFIQWIYIGVADWNVREVFETIDGRPISDVYNNWNYGEPNNLAGKEGCVVLARKGTLNDDDCSVGQAFICKKQLSTLQWNMECNIPDTGYKYNQDLARCYKFHLTPKNWTDAYTICYAEQSYLAVINSDAEAAYLVNMTAEAPKDNVQGDYLRGAVHLGFHNRDGWITVKGVPVHDSGYNGWGYAQPDGGGNENCGSMFYTGELNDIGCFHKMFFICEHEIQIRTEDITLRFGV
ncbi:macrophage mannose receptor 1-like [Epargyreus clarus]|uniref:macrophage mannose receptor 1-like n=1 Tax=Epargyreus clarus TaxID=520877 RepID=UPI003C2BC90B